MVVHPGRPERLNLVRQDVGAHRHDGHPRGGARQAADQPRRHHAVEARHLDVHEHEIVGRRLDGADRPDTVGRDVDDVPGGPEHGAGQLAVDLHVLHQEDAPGASGPRRRRPDGGRGGRRPRQGQGEPEGRAASLRGDETHRAAHQFDQPPADRQPQAGAAIRAADRAVGLREALEQPFLAVRRDPDPGIGHAEADRVAARTGLFVEQVDGHPAPRRELHGVVEEVQQDLPQPPGVAHQPVRHRGVDLGDQIEALGAGRRLDDAQAGIDEGAQRDRFGVEVDRPGLDGREVQDVVHDGAEVRPRGRGEFRVAPEIAVEPAGFGQQPGEADHRVERRADLVAHRREELGLGRVGALGLGAGRLGRRLGGDQRALAVLPGRDVEGQADDPRRDAVAVAMGAPDRLDPAAAAARVRHPERDVEGPALGRGRPHRPQGRGAIRGDDPPHPLGDVHHRRTVPREAEAARAVGRQDQVAAREVEVEQARARRLLGQAQELALLDQRFPGADDLVDVEGGAEPADQVAAHVQGPDHELVPAEAAGPVGDPALDLARPALHAGLGVGPGDPAGVLGVEPVRAGRAGGGDRAAIGLEGLVDVDRLARVGPLHPDELRQRVDEGPVMVAARAQVRVGLLRLRGRADRDDPIRRAGDRAHDQHRRDPARITPHPHERRVGPARARGVREGAGILRVEGVAQRMPDQAFGARAEDRPAPRGREGHPTRTVEAQDQPGRGVDDLAQGLGLRTGGAGAGGLGKGQVCAHRLRHGRARNCARGRSVVAEG